MVADDTEKRPLVLNANTPFNEDLQGVRYKKWFVIVGVVLRTTIIYVLVRTKHICHERVRILYNNEATISKWNRRI